MDRNTEDYTDEELEGICAVDNDWAATELGRRLSQTKHVLMRCSTILSHMTAERPAGVGRFIKGRWMISDEPLRNDAANILPVIGAVMRNEG